MSARTHTQRCPSRTYCTVLVAPAARRAHLQLRAPASAAYTSPALRAVRSVPRPAVSPAPPTPEPQRPPAPSHALADHPPQGSHELHASTSTVHPPSLVPPFLPHLRPHRAHGATPHDRPDAPLSRRSPAPPARRHPSAPAPVPAPRKKSARLPAEVLKLQDFSFYQSISNFIVS